MAEKLPNSTQLGGKHKTDHFYPKIRTQPVYSGADSETKDNKYLYISVTYGVWWKINQKNVKNKK